MQQVYQNHLQLSHHKKVSPNQNGYKHTQKTFILFRCVSVSHRPSTAIIIPSHMPLFCFQIMNTLENTLASNCLP